MSRLLLPAERLPDGHYCLRIVKAHPATSRAGHPTLRVALRVEGGAHAGFPITCSYSLLPQARWHLRRLLCAVGLDDAADEIDTAQLVDAVIEAQVTTRPSPYGPPLCDLQDECSAAVPF